MRMPTLHRRRATPGTVALVSILLVSSLSACATTPVPNVQLAVAEAAVARANTSETSANAPGELQIARDKIASAQRALAAKDYTRAEQLAQQAEIDALVAELHAQSERSRKAAEESRNAALALREEINRKTL